MARNRVMVVEDDDDLREAVVEVLQEHGYEVEGTENGRIALDRLHAAASLPNLIILDLMMPVMSGHEFLEERNRIAALAAIPVMVVSAHRALETGGPLEVEAQLNKPVNLKDLLGVVGKLTRRDEPG